MRYQCQYLQWAAGYLNATINRNSRQPGLDIGTHRSGHTRQSPLGDRYRFAFSPWRCNGLGFGCVWNQMKPFLRLEPGPLAGYTDPLLTLILQHAHWQLLSSIWINRLNYLRTGGKFIRIILITTPTLQRVAVHFGFRISLTSGADKRKCNQTMLISLLWHVTYSLSYHIVWEWRMIFPLGDTFLAGGSQKPQVTHCAKKSS